MRPDREVNIERTTRETAVTLTLAHGAVGTGKKEKIVVDTQLPFFDHLLSALFFHGGFQCELRGKGDIAVDPHHLVEDTGIVLGTALVKLRSQSELHRFGHAVVPMDEALAEAAIDVCGRGSLVYKADYPQSHAGNFQLDLIREFLTGLADFGRISLHALVRYGENGHHMAEALFKSLGRALSQAYTPLGGEGPVQSTKGVLS